MTKLEYALSVVDTDKLEGREKKLLKQGVPLGKVLIQFYCPNHFGMCTVCDMGTHTCKECWNDEFEGV